MNKRILGVDYGSKRIGLALSDDDRRMALAHSTVERGGDDRRAVEAVVAVVPIAEIGEIVVGLPVQMDGVEGPAARRARAFGERLAAHLGRPITFWDERMTTVVAERALRELGLDASARRGGIDRSAATILLQGFLDARESRSWDDENSSGPDAPAQPPRGKSGRRGRSRR
jgi:putative Holliday junction resolvase